MSCRISTKLLIMWLLYNTSSQVFAQTGNRVFSGAEMVNNGIISLATPGGQSWTTDRLATPGYFGLKNGATYTNASDANNINGYVKKYGNQACTFPVGSGTDLRTLSISAPSAITDSYATAWIAGDPSGNMDPTGPNGGAHDVTAVTFPIFAVSRVGQWDWQAGVDMGTTGNGVNLMITVSIPDMTAFSNTSNLRLVGWNGSSWVDLSGMSTASGNTENSTLTGNMQAGISAVAIGSSWWVLPVKLVSFSASEKACSAELSWRTTDEESTEGFEIERSSNGYAFEKTGLVKAKGGNTENNYFITVNQPQNECFYRLKMLDKTGQFTYSPVVYVKTSCQVAKSSVSVYPNPVSAGLLNIQVTAAAAADVHLLLVNAGGQTLVTRDVKLNQGNTNLKLDVRNIPKGVYFIQMTVSGNKNIFNTQKIIIN